MTAPDLNPTARSAGPAAAPRRLLTLDEYYAFEEANPIRHEYVDGEVFAMSPGVTVPHSLIQGNILFRLYGAAQGTPCRVHGSDIKIEVGTKIYYPDAMVACGPVAEKPRAELAPCFIAEVLSPSTRSTDLREKSANYRKLASLQLLLIVDQAARRVNRYWRDASGAWQLEVIIGQGEIPVPCPAPAGDPPAAGPPAGGPLVLTLDDIYQGVTIPPPPDPRRVREATGEYLTGWVSEHGPEFVPDHVPVELADFKG